MLVVFISTDYQDKDKMKDYQGRVSKSSETGDSSNCFSFVVSVCLTPQGGAGPVLALLAVLPLRIRVALLPIGVKCTVSCTKYRRGPTIRISSGLQGLFEGSLLSSPPPGSESPNSVICAWLYTSGVILEANTETLTLFCERLLLYNGVI